MARITANTAAAAAAKPARATAIKARATAVAKPARATAPAARPALYVSFDGAAPIALGAVAMGLFHDAADFANTVVASVLIAEHGTANYTLRDVGSSKAYGHGGTFTVNRKPVPFAVGTAEQVAAFIANRTAPVATPAPVTAPARPAKPAPTAAQAVALKAASGVARLAAITPPATVRVYIKHHGAFDVPAAVIEGKGADFVRTHIVPRVQAALGWPSASVETCTQVAKGIYVAGIMSGRMKVEASFGPLEAGVGPITDRTALPLAPLDKLAQMARVAGIATPAPAPSVRARREAAVIAGAAPRAPEAPRYGAAHLATLADAAKGKLPQAPDFTAETHRRYRPKLAELVALAKAGNIAALESYAINPCSTSPKAMAKYRDAAVIALKAKAAKKAGA